MSGCEEAVEGVFEECCLHDLPRKDRHAPGAVCCWCGLIYLPRTDAKIHGKYEPGLSKTELKKREAAGRRAARERKRERP
jgi:hypothetical protein